MGLGISFNWTNISLQINRDPLVHTVSGPVTNNEDRGNINFLNISHTTLCDLKGDPMRRFV